MKKYYIEFDLKDNPSTYGYVMQSKWFSTKEEALAFVKDNFDFVDLGEMQVCLMSSVWNEKEDDYTDIIMEENLYENYHQ